MTSVILYSALPTELTSQLEAGEDRFHIHVFICSSNMTFIYSQLFIRNFLGWLVTIINSVDKFKLSYSPLPQQMQHHVPLEMHPLNLFLKSSKVTE